MSQSQQISLQASGDQNLKQGIFPQKKYFTRMSSQQLVLTFSNPFTPPKSLKHILTPTAKSAHPSIDKISQSNTKCDVPELIFGQSLSLRKKESTNSQIKTSRKQQSYVSKQKEQVLRSTDGTRSSIVNQFESILNSTSKKDAPSVEIKQNSPSSPSKHERSKSSEASAKALFNQKTKTPSNPVQAKKLQRFSEYSQIQDFPQQMQETILQFKEVLENSFSPPIKNSRDQVEELTEQVYNLKLLIKERDKAWEDKMTQTLKKQKTLVVESFKRMLSELKKMCQWQRFGNAKILNEPVFLSSKKLFSNYPFQHEFKSSMEQIRNTLMQLKILNSQSQALRQELQNLRRTLEEERQIRQDIQEQLESMKSTYNILLKTQSQSKEKEEQYKLRIQSLISEIESIRQGNNNYQIMNQGYDENVNQTIEFTGCIASNLVEPLESRLQKKIQQLTEQNNVLGDLVKELSSKIAQKDEKYRKQILDLNHIHKVKVQRLSNQYLNKMRLSQQKKLRIEIQERKVPINFKSPRKSSLPEKPYQLQILHQIEAVLYS